MAIRKEIFEIRGETFPSNYTPWQRDQSIANIIEVLDNCSFPWERCIPALRHNNKIPFPIEFMDPMDGALGYVSRNRMWLKPVPSHQTIAHELAHVADLATLGEAMAQRRIVFNSSMSTYRRTLLDMAIHNDSNVAHPHSWSPNEWTAPNWEERAVEAITVPWTKVFTPRYVYPDWRFQQNGHIWPDAEAVAKVFMSRPIQVFSDVPESQTHREAIEWCAKNGLVDGYSDGSFNPDQEVTRGQVATILRRRQEMGF